MARSYEYVSVSLGVDAEKLPSGHRVVGDCGHVVTNVLMVSVSSHPSLPLSVYVTGDRVRRNGKPGRAITVKVGQELEERPRWLSEIIGDALRKVLS